MQGELDLAAEAKDSPPEPAPTGDPVDKSKAKKGKIVAKSTGLTYQFQIMESIGVPRAEIKKFSDPLYWLTYFPPIAIVRNPFSFLRSVLANTFYRLTIMLLGHGSTGAALS